MRHVPRVTWVWPGLPQLWRFDSWSGLAQALAFAGLLNFLLLATYGWTEWIAAGVRAIGWLGLGVWWCWAVYRTGRQQLAEPLLEEGQDLFPQAQTEYLKGNWYQAELLLSQMLQHNPRDVDSRLLLATLLRHTDRAADATGQLRRLERTEGSEKWRLEIHREYQRLTEPATAEQWKQTKPAAQETTAKAA